VSELHLFEVVGLEIEYMITDAGSLKVAPEADLALGLLDSEVDLEEGELERGPVSWSNELARHVIELKGTGPFATIDEAEVAFTAAVRELSGRLEAQGRKLMPTAMHPTMDPATETKLWPYGEDIIYRTFDRIFDCRGHGWSNLQSMHVNLPFSGDEELGKLHAAVRLVLPILPALAASSPLVEGRVTGKLDNRLGFYAKNARRIPSVSGAVIPEPVFDRASYEQQILERIYADLAPHDPDGILRHEWANARGAIVRFDRSAIELRVIDTQEQVAADLAVAEAAISAVRHLVQAHDAPLEDQQAWSTDRLAAILWDCAEQGDLAVIEDEGYLAMWGAPPRRMSAGELWAHVLGRGPGAGSEARSRALQVILQEGVLGRRILKAVGAHPAPERIEEVYRELAACLAEGRSFHP